MQRILEWDGKVRMVSTRHQNQSVDTTEDLKIVEARMRFLQVSNL